MQYETLDIQIADKIAVVTLNRPPVNAQNAKMRTELTEAFDVLSDLEDVAVVVQSEFGRRLRSNESGGTDHGRAGAMMVLGPQARGGRLLGRWPGLANDALEEGADLAVTTDYRDVLAEILTAHLGLTDAGAVFPGLTQAPLGLYGRRA